jgi:hypothetical protein
MGVLCTAVICAAGLMLLTRWYLNLDRTAWLKVTSSSTDALSQQINSLAEFCDANLFALRFRAKTYQSHLGPESTWSELEDRYGKSWSIESGAKHENSESTIQAGILTKISPTVADWQTAVDTLGSLEILPGISVSRFEMRTSGDLEHPSVDIIRIVIEINLHRATSTSAIQ